MTGPADVLPGPRLPRASALQRPGAANKAGWVPAPQGAHRLEMRKWGADAQNPEYSTEDRATAEVTGARKVWKPQADCSNQNQENWGFSTIILDFLSRHCNSS